MGINRKLQRNLKKTNKKMEKKQIQQDKKYSNQVYRPDTELKWTGEQFMILQRIAEDLLQNRIHMVNVNVDGKIHKGQSLAPHDWDVYDFTQYVQKLHRDNIDAGLTVPLDVLRKELEAQQPKKEEVQKPEVLPVEADKEVVEEKKEEEVVEGVAKKITFKD